MIEQDSDGYTFSSGRGLYANCGIIGIAPDLQLSEGYDGPINWPPHELDSNPLTAEDMIELADMMIERWQKFRAALSPNPTETLAER